MAQAQTASRPLVVLLSLQPVIGVVLSNEIYQPLVNKLKAKADIKEITDAAEASVVLTGSNKPQAVIVADGAISRRKFSRQRTEAIQYAKDGGTLILGIGFPCFTRPSEVKDLFSAFPLPYEAGDYHRTNFDFNGGPDNIGAVSLPQRYSQKALHLKNVEKKHAVYVPTCSSRIQSMVFGPARVEDLTQTPTTFQTYGSDKLGYLGDVNME